MSALGSVFARSEEEDLSAKIDNLKLIAGGTLPDVSVRARSATAQMETSIAVGWCKSDGACVENKSDQRITTRPMNGRPK